MRIKNTKYVPLRKCTVCMCRKEKDSLFRIVCVNGEAIADTESTHDGRGCYVCKSAECISLMEKKSAVGRSFKKRFSSENYKSLTENLEKELINYESAN